MTRLLYRIKKSELLKFTELHMIFHYSNNYFGYHINQILKYSLCYSRIFLSMNAIHICLFVSPNYIAQKENRKHKKGLKTQLNMDWIAKEF